jgi:hypothetical protein
MDQLLKYCDTNDSSDLKNLPPNIKLILLNNAPKTITKYKNNNNIIFVKRAKQIIDLLSYIPPDEDYYILNGLSWTGNSCYIDSVIFALFAMPSKFIYQHLLSPITKSKNKQFCSKIQRELLHITVFLRSENKKPYTCSNLRKIISTNPHSQNFHLFDMNDASEFLMYILDIFNSTNIAISQNSVFVTSDKSIHPKNLILSSEHIFKDSSIIRYIDPFILKNLNQNKFHDIRDFLTLKSDEFLDEHNKLVFKSKKYNRKININVLLDSPYLIFNFDRALFSNFGRSTFLNTKIVPSQILTLHSNRRLLLSTIIVFSNSHYICYFQNCFNWFIYNDLKNDKIQLIGSYFDMLNMSPSPISNGTLYFYDTV